MILICVRMIFPVELLSISHNVYLPDLLATIVGETRRVRFFHDTVSWWNILRLYGAVASYIRCSSTSNVIMTVKSI